MAVRPIPDGFHAVIRHRPSEDDLRVAADLGVEDTDRDLWARCLEFPMLTAAEAERVMSYTGGYVSNKIDTLSLDLLAGRLSLNRETLKNKLLDA